jgi:hypothetical protein
MENTQSLPIIDETLSTTESDINTEEELSTDENNSYISDTSDEDTNEYSDDDTEDDASDEESSIDNDMSGAVDDNTCILRGKWLYDGSRSVDDMITALEKEIMLLKHLKDDGWEVDDEVVDDYAYLCKTPEENTETPVVPSDVV